MTPVPCDGQTALDRKGRPVGKMVAAAGVSSGRASTATFVSAGVASRIAGPRTTPRNIAILLGAAAALAAVAFLVLYPHIGFDADSVAYVGVARNIASGHGVTYPFRVPGARMTDFPPGYPLVLAAGHTIGFPVVGFAHVLQGALLGVAAALVALLVLQASGSMAFAGVAFFLIAAAPGLDEVFSTVYSEPLAIALQLGALALLVAWARSHRRSLLVAAGVCAALGPIVRWAGIAMVVTGAIVVAAYTAAPLGDRLRRATLWGGACLVPAVVAVAANRGASHSGTGTGTARNLAWHPVGWSQLSKGFDTVGSWLLPRQVHERWLFGLVLVGIAISAAISYAARRGLPAARAAVEHAGAAIAIPAVFVAVYVVTILVSTSLFDAATPLDARILSPAYAALIPALVGGLAVWFTRSEHNVDVLRPVFAVCAVAVVLVGVRAVTTATGNQDSRLGYATSHWRRSPVMRQIDGLVKPTWVVTNAPEAVYLQTGREARGLPSKYSSTSLQPESDYPQRLSDLIAKVRAHHGVFAMFDEVKGRPWLPKADELEHHHGLRVVARVADGVLLAPAG
ncbi:MAG: hypothetical protein JWL83_2876 [Actinomycetia bacterium]|nr:hypothetical protein [Actinomycetes bacterium]